MSEKLVIRQGRCGLKGGTKQNSVWSGNDTIHWAGRVKEGAGDNVSGGDKKPHLEETILGSGVIRWGIRKNRLWSTAKV